LGIDRAYLVLHFGIYADVFSHASGRTVRQFCKEFVWSARVKGPRRWPNRLTAMLKGEQIVFKLVIAARFRGIAMRFNPFGRGTQPDPLVPAWSEPSLAMCSSSRAPLAIGQVSHGRYRNVCYASADPQVPSALVVGLRESRRLPAGLAWRNARPAGPRVTLPAREAGKPGRSPSPARTAQFTRTDCFYYGVGTFTTTVAEPFTV
jgi:hypothetical protein